MDTLRDNQTTAPAQCDPGTTADDRVSYLRTPDDLQQQLLQQLAKANDLPTVVRQLAQQAYPFLDAVQVWYGARGERSGQVVLQRLLDLPTEEVLLESLPDLEARVQQMVEEVLATGQSRDQLWQPQLYLCAAPVFFQQQRPSVLVALCLVDSNRTTGSCDPAASESAPAASGRPNSEAVPNPRSARTVTSQITSLPLLQLLASHLTLWQVQRATSQPQDPLAKLLSANLREIMNSSSRIQACSLLCTRFAGYLTASHLTVFQRTSQRDFRLAGFSGTTQVDQSGAVYQSLHAACLAYLESNPEDAFATSQQEGVLGEVLKQAAHQLHQSFLLAAPIRQNQQFDGVVLLAGDSRLSQQTITESFPDRLLAVTEQLACSLHWHQSPWHRFGERLMSGVNKHRKWLVAGLLGILVTAMIPLPYRMNCDCGLVATENRYVVAPFAGRLAEVQVEPGQNVDAGQLLATMDDRDLRLELIAKESEYDREIQKSHASRAAGNLAESRIAELEAQRILQQTKLVQERLQRQELKSPVAGTLVHGDLRQLQGAPVELGQELFEIASLDQLIVEIEIPEYQYRYARPGQPVSLTLEAYPYDHWTGHLIRVMPSAEVRDGQNVFLAEVQITNANSLLRPGMKGQAVIRGDYYPLAWNWLHYPYEKLRRLVRWL